MPLPPLPEQRRIVARIEELAGRIAEAKGLRNQSDSAIEVFAASTRAATFRSLARKKQVQLTELAELERGRILYRPRNDPRFFGGEHPWIQIGEIENAGKHITRHSQTLNDEGLAISRKFPAGTVLISIAATIGAAGILDFACCVPDSVVGMMPREGVNGEYLYHFICHARNHLEQFAPESARKNINLRILSELRIPDLAVDEQADVVELLDRAEQTENRLREESKKSRQLLDALLPSILDKAFRGEL